MEQQFFEEFLAIIGASLLAIILLNRFKLPSIIAYLIAGSLIGPHLLGYVDQPSDFAFLAEFGVVFLLFSLGLEFSLPRLLELRSSVFGLGSIQVGVCGLVFGGAVLMWGASIEAAIIIAGALALSSTAIVTKELSSLQQVHARHGQLSIGVLLFQDLVAVVLLIMVPVLAGTGAGSVWTSLGIAMVKGILLMGLFFSIGKWVLPLLYKEVAQTRSEEIFLLTTLVIVLLAAWITHSLHLSMALGGFVIGMMLGESQYRHQINSDIRNFKDILLGLFFVTIGMSIQIDLLLEFWPRIIMFTVFLILIKVILISFVAQLSGDGRNTALQTGLNLAQAGEFGLALMALGVMHEVIPDDQASFIIIVAILSMAASPFLIRHNDWISTKIWGLLGGGEQSEKLESTLISIPHQDHVIIGGFGRVGQMIANLMYENKVSYIAIEHDTDVVITKRKEGRNVIYGDCTNTEILKSCHLDAAKMAILTFRSIDLAKTTIEHIRSLGVKVPIIVRTHEHGDFTELVSLGADHVFPEMLEGSLAIASQALTLLEVAQDDINEQIQAQRELFLKNSAQDLS